MHLMTSKMNARLLINQMRYLSSSSKSTNHYKLLICGGGAGGLSVGAKFADTMAIGKVAIVEPADVTLFYFIFS